MRSIRKDLRVKFYRPKSFDFFVCEGGPILIQYHFLKVDPPKCGGCPACGSDGEMLTLARTRVCVAKEEDNDDDYEGANKIKLFLCKMDQHPKKTQYL